MDFQILLSRSFESIASNVSKVLGLSLISSSSLVASLIFDNLSKKNFLLTGIPIVCQNFLSLSSKVTTSLSAFLISAFLVLSSGEVMVDDVSVSGFELVDDLSVKDVLSVKDGFLSEDDIDNLVDLAPLPTKFFENFEMN